MQNGPEEVREDKKATGDQFPFHSLAAHACETTVAVRQTAEPVRGDILPEPEL